MTGVSTLANVLSYLVCLTQRRSDEVLELSYLMPSTYSFDSPPKFGNKNSFSWYGLYFYAEQNDSTCVPTAISAA